MLIFGTRRLRRSCITLIITVFCSVYFVLFIYNSKSLHPSKWQQLWHIKNDPTSTTSTTSTEPHFSYKATRQEALNNNMTLSEFLYKEVRVLCWIMTSPKNHIPRAQHVKNTWGKRCNKLLFMSTEADPDLGSIALEIPEGYNYLWAKTKSASQYINEHYINDADWFFKADDDTYAIIENLRYLLYPYAAETPLYFGFHMTDDYVQQGYMSGGAGYVLSRAALRRFVELAIPNSEICSEKSSGYEDKEIARCLYNVYVEAGDTRDAYGRLMFFPVPPDYYFLSEFVSDDVWYKSCSLVHTENNFNCCSNYAISFHMIKPIMMYAYDYVLYHSRPYGIIEEPDMLPPKLKVGDVKRQWISKSSNSSL